MGGSERLLHLARRMIWQDLAQNVGQRSQGPALTRISNRHV